MEGLSEQLIVITQNPVKNVNTTHIAKRSHSVNPITGWRLAAQ